MRVEATALYEKTVKLQREALGPGHGDLARTLNDFGALCLRLNRLAQAESLYSEAERIARQVSLPSSLIN